MILAVTGHRPEKLGGHSPALRRKLAVFASFQLRNFIQAHGRPDKIISGMALGWDQAVAIAAIAAGIPLVAAVPCDAQDATWPAESRAFYRILLRRAAEFHVISPGPYEGWKMNTRNEWMVDHSGRLLALWDGSQGGTANCVRYARGLGRPINNLWSEWEKFTDALHAAD